MTGIFIMLAVGREWERVGERERGWGRDGKTRWAGAAASGECIRSMEQDIPPKAPLALSQHYRKL